MRTEPERLREEGIVPRLLAALATVGCRYPWRFLIGTALSCTLCMWYTAANLTYQTQRNDLHGKDREYFKRWQKYVAEFGDDDDMVVVVKGANKAALIRAIESLAGEIHKRSDLFDRVFYKVDLGGLRNRALLFLPADHIRLIQDKLKNLSLLLEPPVLGGLDPLFGWKSLTLAQLFKEGERKVLALAADRRPVPDDLEFLKQLAAITACATRTLSDPSAYANPWQSILPEPSTQQDDLAEPRYFFDQNGAIAFLLIRPFKDEGGGFTFAQQSINGLRALIADTARAFPELEIGLTGLAVLENDEMVATQYDTQLAGWLALAGVALLYFAVYRGWRFPMMTVGTLLVGTAWALGWLTLTVGHLNILSSAFAVMLIGMGDYGILWVTRFSEERRTESNLVVAMQRTARHVGPSILTAAMTTALAFFATMLADLRAVAELGWIAGCGVLLCAVSCFTCMPPLLAIFGKKVGLPASDGAKSTDILPLAIHQAERRTWLPFLLGRPRHVLAASLGATLVLGYFALQIRYDHNLLHIQAQNTESVRWERTLIEHTTGASWHALSHTNTPEEALDLKARFEKLPAVSRVVEVASLVPRDQERKLELLRDIQLRLRRLPKRAVVIPHALPSVHEVKRTAAGLLDHIAALNHPELAGSLRALLVQLESVDPKAAAGRLKCFEESLTGDLAEDLHRLHDVSTPALIQLGDLPQCLRERYVGQSGKWLLRIFARDCLWEYEPLNQFVAQVRTVDPDATGNAFTTLEGLRAMKLGFLWAGVYALVAMVVVLLVDFGSLKHMLVALSPLAMGVIVSLGLMHLCGLSLNPANMIAFPLILGVGADNGVHVMHDYRGRKRGSRYVLGFATGRGIMVAALTTILGFGTLMIAQHRGLASLGLVLSLGVTACMVTALVFLPCLLGMTSMRRKQAEKTTLRIPAKRAV